MAPTLAENLMKGPLVGTMFTMFLYGIVSMQAYLYFDGYIEDPPFMKTLVGTIWILETAHSILSMHCVFSYLIVNFGNNDALLMVEWSVVGASVIGFFIGWTVNMFFVWRIWTLSRNISRSVIIAFLATGRLVFGVYVCYLGMPYSNWKAFHDHTYPFVITALSLSVACDTAIAIAISWQLLEGRRLSGFRTQTNVLVNRLLVYTVHTGAITSLCAIIELITFLTMPQTLVFLSFVSIQSKLYANSLLATLNARNDLRLKTNIITPTSPHPSSLYLRPVGMSPRTSPNLPIAITKETVISRDDCSTPDRGDYKTLY